MQLFTSLIVVKTKNQNSRTIYYLSIKKAVFINRCLDFVRHNKHIREALVIPTRFS